MAKPKSQAQEREYVIPLRREILKVPRHKRTPKAVKAVKQFLAKHMRIADRDVTKIKLDYELNHELWHRGIRNPPTKIKVKVKRDGEVIRVTLIDLPEKTKFRIAREEKKKKALEKPKKKVEAKKEEKKEPTEEAKKEESEKKESAKEVKAAQAKTEAKTQKHTQSAKTQKTQPQRKALQK